jgi:hypothetical protein
MANKAIIIYMNILLNPTRDLISEKPQADRYFKTNTHRNSERRRKIATLLSQGRK